MFHNIFVDFHQNTELDTSDLFVFNVGGLQPIFTETQGRQQDLHHLVRDPGMSLPALHMHKLYCMCSAPLKPEGRSSLPRGALKAGRLCEVQAGTLHSERC